MALTEGKKWVLLWLWTGLIMILVQIALGGITRLTGSGLSITRWDIVTGIWYPLSESDWNRHFDLYKATPQYLKINQGMELEQFKFIFFWEYFHRLWARIMGIVFVFPLLVFSFKKWIPSSLFRSLTIVFLLAVFVASLGWIMVASGLVDYPWVNAYKLSFHLMSAVLLIGYLFHVVIKFKGIHRPVDRSRNLSRLLSALVLLSIVQIFLGGVMAGMKAALVAPTWPTIKGVWFPAEVFQWSSYSDYLFSEYEMTHIGPVIIQFFHRTVAYLLFVLVVWLFIHVYRKGSAAARKQVFIFLLLCLTQVVLGIWTLIQSVGYIPLWPGVLHQFTGILFLLYGYHLKRRLDIGKSPADELARP
ncbi:MAG TPA: COX15/CtaA family protein [Saprospiraceae bacterium]|nr:COX15/CtaA family protein [Saprospiraceae bacterium]